MIYNLGSINIDHTYRVPHLPGAGETLAATSLLTGLGGKGANQSVAAALAGAAVTHIGAVGPDGAWAVDQLSGFGVDTAHVTVVQAPTAHAIINVDPAGENAITIYPGANHKQDFAKITQALQGAGPDDWLILQNETSHQVETAQLAQALGMTIAYSAAPFEAGAVQAVLPYVSLLIMNEVEARQLSAALFVTVAELPAPQIIVTKGANGADWIETSTGDISHIPAFDVAPVDTTGAGDTFAGYAIAGLSQGMAPTAALRRASAAAALSTTRQGTANAIPCCADVEAFVANS